METFIFILSLIYTCLGNDTPKICKQAPDPGSFYYFAYGSNLLSKGMLFCKTAVSCHEPAKLENYRLDFTLPSTRWNGAVATVIEDPDSTVWGNLWQISVFESTKLDQQEGVSRSVYYPRQVNVSLASGPAVVPTRVYIARDPPAEKVAPEDLPSERQPSRTYHQVILLGALRCYLPVSYLNYLLRFPNNGRLASSLIREDLGYPFYDSSFT